MEETYFIQVDNFSLTQSEFFIRLMVATGVGLVIGLEREHAYVSKKREIFAGIRTFVFVVLFGFLTTFLSYYLSPWVFAIGLLGTIAIVTVSYWISANKGAMGGTTELAFIISFLLGSVILLGFTEAGLAVTVVVVVLLSLKVRLKTIVDRITEDEMVAFIKFVVLALLILPFLPNTFIGPYEVFNPRELGWVIVLTSGIGFFGYILMKFLGSDRGILLTGIAGGLVSSTIVTWVFSKKSSQVPELSKNCAIAILVASSIMVIRVYVWIIIFNPSLLPELILPLFIVFITGLLVAFYLYRSQLNKEATPTNFPLGDPLNLRDAVFFGFLYTAVLLFVSYANNQFGTKGIFLSTAIAALTDIDAITISVSKLGGDALTILTAQNAILLATLCNTIVKIGIVLWAGSGKLRKYVMLGYGLIFFAGIIGFLLLNL